LTAQAHTFAAAQRKAVKHDNALQSFVFYADIIHGHPVRVFLPAQDDRSALAAVLVSNRDAGAAVLYNHD